MEPFFVLQPQEAIMAGAQWATAAPYELRSQGESQRCPVCGSPVTARRWLPPHQIKISRAKPTKWADFMWGPGSSLFISRRFKEIYQSEGLSGINTFWEPAQIVRLGALKTGQFPHEPPVYHLVSVLWGGANQDDAASKMEMTHPAPVKCTYCRTGRSGRRQEGIVVKAGSWNGKDVFLTRGAPAVFMVSERFKQVAEGHQLTNARFIPANRFAYDDSRFGRWYVNESLALQPV